MKCLDPPRFARGECGLTSGAAQRGRGLTDCRIRLSHLRASLLAHEFENSPLATRLLLRNRIDKLVVTFQKAQPEFVAGYRSARVVIDRHGGGGSAEPPTEPPKPA